MVQISDIEKQYEEMKKDEPRKAAELAYVIAMLAKGNGENEKAIKFGKECISILDSLNVQTMEECATQLVVVNGISLPEFIHADVVRDRLSPLKL